jgi:hypothetical protein
MPMTKAEQVECLRQYGHEKEAGMLERGELAPASSAHLETAWACLKTADALRGLVSEMNAPAWLVTIRGQSGYTDTVKVRAASEAAAAFLAGRRTGIPGAELVGVEPAPSEIRR